MAQIRIATFNVENLLQRFDFHRYGQLVREPALEILGVEDTPEGLALRKALHVVLTDDSRQMTAQAIRDTQADVVCLQEIDNRQVLDDFDELYLRKSTGVHYGWRRLLEGNDNRGIDVAVMSKQRIDVKTHCEHTFDDFDLFNQDLEDYGLSPGDRIFRRDALEVETKVGGTRLTIYVCHFKSMTGDRDQTRPVRRAEAAAVRKLIEDKFGPNPGQGDWLVCGDLNDYVEDDAGQPALPSGLEPLVDGTFAVNLVGARPVGDRWTHYYASEQSHHQLDYILASPALAARNPGVVPDVIRQGQPYRVTKITGLSRYPRIGFDRPKASDHCPVAVTLTV